MLLAARAVGLGATLTTLYLNFEKEVEAALGLPADVHSYALIPIGYPMGRHWRGGPALPLPRRHNAGHTCPDGSPAGSAAGIALLHRVRHPLPKCFSRCSLRCGPVTSGNPHCELREFANRALDFNLTAVLLGHDVIADRETETRALP